MVFTKEMSDIVDYLSERKDYVIYAGFAAYLQAGVESSADVDVFVSSMDDVKHISADFFDKGWKKKAAHTDKKHYLVCSVEKGKTTFDICFSRNAAAVLLPQKVRMNFRGKSLYVLSPEALFLTKMNQLSRIDRSDVKTERDRRVIAVLRKKIVVRKLKSFVQSTKDMFWLKGYS